MKTTGVNDKFVGSLVYALSALLFGIIAFIAFISYELNGVDTGQHDTTWKLVAIIAGLACLASLVRLSQVSSKNPKT